MTEDFVTRKFARDFARRLAKLERGQRKTGMSDLRHSALDHGARIPVKDEQGNTTAYVGSGPTGIEHVGGPAPEQPSAPFVDAGQRVVKVQHSGLDVHENPAPADFHKAEVHVSQDEVFEPSLSTFATNLDAANGSVTHSLPAGEWWVGIVWVTLSGRRSVMSEPVLADVEPLVNTDDLEDTLAEAEQIIADAVAVAQTQLDTLRDRLDNFEEYDPTDLIAQINQVTEDLADARQEAAGLVSDLADQVDGIKIPDVSGFITQAEVDAAATAAETAAKEHADLVAQGAEDNAIAEAEAKANAAQAAAEAAAKTYTDQQDAATLQTAAQDATAKADAAQSAAEAEADRLAKAEAQAAQTEAILQSKADALAQANAARDAAIASASDDATAKAEAAQAAAEEYAEAEAQAKADAAQAEAIRQAAEDATAKANKAREDAEAAANDYADQQDAQVKIDAALDAQEKADAVANELHAALQVIEQDYSHIWRQADPPPPGTHYAWLGERNGSVSVRLDGDGNETARNVFTQPRDFAITGSDRRAAVDLSTPGRVEVLASNYSNAYAWALQTYIRFIDDPDFAEGEYERTYTMSVEVKAHVQHPEGHYQLRFDLRTPAVHYSEPGRIEDTGGEWVRISTTLTLGADLQGDRSLFNFTDGANHTPGDVIEYRNWKFERGSTATPYFDGSTVSDRAHDLWYNAQGVPHEWVNGQGWVELTDQRITDLIQAAQAAQDRADEAHTEAGEAWDHADAALNRAISAEDNAKTHADNLPKMLGGTGGPVGTAPNGSIWFRRDSNNTVIGRWERINGSWVQQEVSGEIIDNLEAGKITALHTEFAESVIGKLWTQLAIVDRLIATSAWIGGAMIGDDAVEAKHITASESLSAKVAEFLKLSVADLVAGTADIDDAVVNKFWAALAVIERLRAAEAWVTGDLVVGETIRSSHIEFTETLVGNIAELLHLVVDRIDANALWADQTWQAAGHFGSEDADQQTRVDGTGLRITKHDHDDETSTDIVRLGGEGIGLVFADENGELTGSLSHEGDASFRNVAVETLTHGGRPLQDPACQDYVHPSGNQSLVSWRPRAVVGRAETTLPNTIDTPYREYAFLEVAAHLEEGRSYWLTVTQFLTRNAAHNSNYLRIRATTDGTHPNGTSPTVMNQRNVVGGNDTDILMQGNMLYTPTVTGVHRFMVSVYTYNGVRMTFGGQEVQLIVEDAGSAVPDGTVVRDTYINHPSGNPDIIGPIQSTDSITTEWHAQGYQNYSHNGTVQQTTNFSTSGYGASGPTQGLRPIRPEQGPWVSFMGLGEGTNDQTLQQSLAGAEIQSITLEARGQGSFNDSNMLRVFFYAQPQTTAPAQYTSSNLGIPLFGGASQLFNVGQTRRINLPVETFGPLLKSGDFRSIGVWTSSDQPAYAGWLSWSTDRPKLIISYTKEGA